MNTIEITYRQFPFLTRRIKSELPASWNELTEKQFIAAAAMIENNDPSLQWLSVMTALPYRCFNSCKVRLEAASRAAKQYTILFQFL